MYLLLIIMSCLCFVVGCNTSKKSAKTSKEFEQYMKEKEFEVIDATNQFEEGALESCSIAMNKEYQVEFYVCNNVKDAKDSFTANKDAIGKKSNVKVKEVEVSINDYSHYTVFLNNTYYHLTQIDNTLVYAVTEKKYTESVKEVLEGIGY